MAICAVARDQPEDIREWVEYHRWAAAAAAAAARGLLLENSYLCSRHHPTVALNSSCWVKCWVEGWVEG
jgi:hypothetical protein